MPRLPSDWAPKTEEYSALYTAVDKNDLSGLKELLASNPDLNLDLLIGIAYEDENNRYLRDYYPNGGFTALHTAADLGYLEIAQELLSFGAAVDPVDELDSIYELGMRTPLHCAASGGHIDVLELLLDHGADVNYRSEKGDSALHRVIQGVEIMGQSREPDVVATIKLLLDWGCDIHAYSDRFLTHRRQSHGTILQFASGLGNIQLVELLLERGACANISPLERERSEECPLSIAAEKDQISIAQLLLQHGARVTSECISSACSLAMLELLFPHATEWAISNSHPLHNAAVYGICSMVPFLLERNFDISEWNHRGETPLHLACRYSSAEMVDLLISNGANVNKRELGRHENSPLHIICNSATRGRKKINALLKAGADLEARASRGETPLLELVNMFDFSEHRSCRHSDSRNYDKYQVFKILIKAGAKVSAIDNNRRTALHCCVKYYVAKDGDLFSCVIELLIEKGIDFKARDDMGYTAMERLVKAHMWTPAWLFLFAIVRRRNRVRYLV